MILDAVERALSELDPARLVENELRRGFRKTHRVIAIGKAAAAMFEGAKARLDIEDSVVVRPEDAGHPLPDKRSVRAAERCLDLVARPGDTPILVLVSGGASALVCAPAKGISLADKRAVTRALLSSSATIQEFNIVRKHLSRIKGGALARAAAPRHVSTLVVSDVIGGDASDVGSGPTVRDTSTIDEARRILARHAPKFASLPLVATKPPDPRLVRARILVSPARFAQTVARELTEVRTQLRAPAQASVQDLAREYVALSKLLRPGTAVVRAAEPSIVVPPSGGQGGRSTHLAALVAREIAPGVTFAAIASDGVDGSSGTAGAIVDAHIGKRAGLEDAITSFDTGAFLLDADAAVPSHPTGHNLADVHVLIRAVRGSRGTARGRRPARS